MADLKVTRDNLQTADAVLGLGLVIVKTLHEQGIVSVFINADGQVELCPLGEIELDSLSEGQALDTLIDRGYEEAQLMAYLRGRAARETHRNG